MINGMDFAVNKGDVVILQAGVKHQFSRLIHQLPKFNDDGTITTDEGTYNPIDQTFTTRDGVVMNASDAAHLFDETTLKAMLNNHSSNASPISFEKAYAVPDDAFESLASMDGAVAIEGVYEYADETEAQADDAESADKYAAESDAEGAADGAVSSACVDAATLSQATSSASATASLNASASATATATIASRASASASTIDGDDASALAGSDAVSASHGAAENGSASEVSAPRVRTTRAQLSELFGLRMDSRKAAEAARALIDEPSKSPDAAALASAQTTSNANAHEAWSMNVVGAPFDGKAYDATGVNIAGHENGGRVSAGQASGGTEDVSLEDISALDPEELYSRYPWLAQSKDDERKERSTLSGSRGDGRDIDGSGFEQVDDQKWRWNDKKERDFKRLDRASDKENFVYKSVYFDLNVIAEFGGPGKVFIESLHAGKVMLQPVFYRTNPDDRNAIAAFEDLCETVELAFSLRSRIKDSIGVSKRSALEVKAYGQLLSLLGVLQYEQHYVIFGNKAAHSKKQQKVMNDLIRYILSHYKEQITLGDLAAIAKLQPTYLCRAFKEYTDKSPLEFVNTVRMEEACRLLRETDYPIYKVVFNVGYRDPGFFSRQFKKFTGLKAREYRSQYRDTNKKNLSDNIVFS